MTKSYFDKFKQARLFEPKLDQAIKKVMELDSEGIFRQKLELINQTNIQLVAMENQIFELARNNKQPEAIALINSQAYNEQKGFYAAGLSEFVKLHELETDQQQIKLQQEVNLSKWYFGFLLIVIALIWLPVERFLRKNQKKINQKNIALEYEIINRIATEKSLQESGKQLKLANRQLTLLLESTPAMIYTCQAFGNFDPTSISENIKERLGYDPKTFMEIPGFWEMNIHPDDKERVFSGINALFENGEHHHQYRFKHKNGAWCWMSDSLKLVNDENGNPKEIIGYWQDITEQKKREAKIIRMNETLEQKVEERTKQLVFINDNLTDEIEESKQAAEALAKAKVELDLAIASKSEFLSRVSHELRTPLNSILGFAQLLEMGELTPINKKGVNHILKSGKHLLSLVNEVLELSKTDTGKFSISMEPIYLNGIMKETVEISQAFADENHIKLELENVDEKDLFVKADYQKLTQVLLNILNNAIKYNKEGGLVTVKTESTENNNIRISITDTGIGIPAEEMHKLFIPFQRIGKEISVLEGTGLGLSVAKKLTEAMNGTIGVESTVGKGSAFWIELPQIESQLERHEREAIFETTTPANLTKVGTLLYIEDNISNLQLVKQIIETQRPTIKLITSLYGKDTVKLALDYKPDVILLDLDLSDIHGSNVLQLLQKEPKTKAIPVIILSADGVDKQIKKILKLGAKAYLTKPLEVLEFLREIDKIMSN
jgi:PAS domain S-box-containing protein